MPPIEGVTPAKAAKKASQITETPDSKPPSKRRRQGDKKAAEKKEEHDPVMGDLSLADESDKKTESKDIEMKDGASEGTDEQSPKEHQPEEKKGDRKKSAEKKPDEKKPKAKRPEAKKAQGKNGSMMPDAGGRIRLPDDPAAEDAEAAQDDFESADVEAEEIETEDRNKALERITGLWSPSDNPSKTEPTSPTFDPQCTEAMLTEKKMQEFALICEVLESSKKGDVSVPLTNMFRRMIQHCGSSQDVVSDLAHMLEVLLNCRPSLSHKVVSQAIGEAYGLKCDRNGVVDEGDLPDIALAGRKKQMNLFGSRLTNEHLASVLKVGAEQKECKPLLKALGSSRADHRETWYLVRLLLGRTLIKRRLVLQSLAQAFSWTRPVGCNPSTRVFANKKEMASMMAVMEESVIRAYSETGFDTLKLSQALLAGCDATALGHACGATPMVPLQPMQPEVSESIPSALSKLEGQYTADWLYAGEKIHVHLTSQEDGEQQIVVYDMEMKPWEQHRLDEILPALQMSLKNISECILEAIVPKKQRPKKLTKEERATKEAAEANAGQGTEKPPEPEEPKIPENLSEAIVPKKQRAKKLTKEEKATKEAAEANAGQDTEKPPEPEEPKMCIIILDMIAMNGEPLVNRCLRGRRAELSAKVLENNQVKHVRTREVPKNAGPSDIEKILNDAVASDHTDPRGRAKAEHRGFGLILKQLDGDAIYKSGCKTSQWQIIQKPVLTGEEADKALLSLLSDDEQQHLADVDAFHFAVISARRAQTDEGIADILTIQKQFTTAGVKPIWYVDLPSLEDYRKLGLDAIDGGKLIPARNKALDDANAANKVCVQCSDDIGKWQFLRGAAQGVKNQAEANAHWRMADLYVCSPVACARYFLAKMRMKGAKLGGVFPLANGGRSFMADAEAYSHFILGDFFVADVSDVRFDKNMTLKEDYDFTCSHLFKYGVVVRFNRLLITAKHETNHGGACSTRDSKGEEEQKNIKILKEKWPGVFSDNGRRANQVIMRWNSLRRTEMKDPDAKITW